MSSSVVQVVVDWRCPDNDVIVDVVVLRDGRPRYVFEVLQPPPTLDADPVPSALQPPKALVRDGSHWELHGGKREVV